MSAGTSWIQRLSKAALTRLLTEAGEAVSETEKIEVLRTRIRKLARKSPGDFDVSPGRLELLGEMNKRRRTSSVASRQEEDADTDSVPEPARKKKKLDPSELCQQLYDTIRNYKKDDGTLLCDSFIRAPKRRQEPAYYEVVSNPIDMLKVQQKLKTDEYEDIEDLATDIQLICNNAKAFYKRTSQEYRDACELWELFVANKNRLVDSEESGAEHKGKIILKVGKLARRAAAAAEARKQDSEATEGENSESSSNNPDDDMNQYEELFTAVMLATDSDNRPLHTVFQLLPSKKRYPEYYDVIENPIDLKMIATKIQQNKYTSINDMEKDLLQMTKNACQFNEPGSQIYKDAKALRKVITGKKTEVEHGKLEHGKFVPGKTSERISGPSRNKRLRGVQSLSAITAALRDEDEDSDEGEMDEEPEIEDADNPRWQLFESVKNASSPAGHILSEPFWKLPSKRYYPDYYKEIKNPVSLSQIKKKLKRGDYGTVSEVAGDMNIMFENAKKYNRPDSRLYKDAVKLQKLMQTKVHEILDLEQDSDSDGDSDDRSRKRSRGKFSVTPKVLRYKDDLPLKKRLHALGKCLLEYVHEDGRQPILMFMEKPSKKLYPDYFQVITEPIDMLTIQANINAEKYNSEEEIISDFKLMFNNCRQYNEEGSMIYEDANKLEHVLMEKLKELGPLNDLNKKGKGPVKVRKSTSAQAQKLKTLYDTIKDYKDPKGRQLSLIFQKLPSKIEYPDYYEVIKRPIDLERISQKLKTSQYETLDDIVSDFVLMFDNACKYNEPDSQIYKDALMLQRVALQTKLQLREDEESVPDVTAAVQELLTSLFIAIYNHQDEEGRCFSDSMAELPEHDEVDGQKVRALSLDLIKRRLDRGLYRRLDTFQEDVFACLERARRLSRTDSQVFEDSIELQSCFIRQRDELCRGGDLLHSPALNYTLLDMAEAVEATRQHKLLEEQPEEEAETRSSDDSLKESGASAGGDSMSFNQQVYRVGDFVYVEPKERGMESSIIHIERLWTNQEGQQMMYGNVLFRPNETYHVTTRKFLEKEVFKSDVHKATPLNQLLGVCCVMSVKDYFRSIPEGFAEKDVYVCESRYSTRARAFKKIKVWPFITTQNLKLIPREEVLEPKRIMSVYRERVEKHKEEIAELEEREKFVVKEKPNIEVFYPQGVEGHTYFEQYNTPACLIRTGDCVYVRTDGGRQFVAQVDTIWTTKNGVCYFRGPWLVTPPEIPHAPTRLFYKQEVFLSTLEDTNPVENIAGKCAVLEHGEYISCRPTEIPEHDVYVCESLYDEARRQVRKLSREGLKKYSHSNAVLEDEIYFFRRLINPPKIGSESAQHQPDSKQQGSNFDMIAVDPDLLEDSLDGGPPSMGSGDIPSQSSATPLSSKKKLQNAKKLVTGYLLYSSDVRRAIAANHPDSTFGEISRIVGNEWRHLPAQEKQAWEERAARINEEQAAKADLDRCPSPASSYFPVPQGPPVENHVFECLWDSCDWQFEDIADCFDHAAAEPHGHVFTHFASVPSQEAEFQCQWRGCGRIRKCAPPFPNIQRLARHVKEVHILKGNGRVIMPHDRSRNYVSSRRPPLPVHKQFSSPATPQASYQHMHMANPTSSLAHSLSRQTPSPHAHFAAIPTTVRATEPLFVSVPPRPQRLLHSEAYIRYIEGLQADNRYMSNWDRQLRATPETTHPPDPSKLPAHWLSNSVGNHGSIVNALWALRDFMMRDALGINKAL
ncbi:protein polybromo-1 isoform X8 [Bacillus rossius redtenbacheri]|uniref:protein polybromo-1 isoform X8 n=1 Tax=Bacillus rossius redtenbacheri TaxID=93214 RepID=UPI002FDDFB36